MYGFLQLPVLLIGTAFAVFASTGYVTTGAQTLSAFTPDLSAENAAILAGPGAGQIAFSRDGSTVYVGESTGAVRVIDSATNQLLAVITVSVQVTSLAVSPDTKTLYVGGIGSSRVLVIDVASGRQVGAIPIPQASAANCLALSPNGGTLYVSYGAPSLGEYLTCGSYQGQFVNPGGVLSASTSTFQVLQHFNTGNIPALALALTADGTALITGSPLQITRFSTSTGQIESSIEFTDPNPVTFLALSPDDTGLVVALLDAPIVLLDPKTLVQTNMDKSVQATNLAFSPDGKTCFFANNAILPSVLGSFETATFGAPVQRSIPLPTVWLAVSPTNSDVYVTNTDSASFAFDSKTDVVGGFLATPGYVPLVPSPDGRLVYGYAKSPGLQVYSPTQPLPIEEIALSASHPYASAFHITQDGTTGYAALEETGSFSQQIAIAVVDLAHKKVEQIVPFPPLLKQYSFFFSTISPDGSAFYFQSQGDFGSPLNLLAWNPKTGSTAETQLQGQLSSILVSPDGKYVYVATLFEIYKLDAVTLATIQSLPLDGPDEVTGFAIGPGGQKVYTALENESAGNDEILEIDSADLTVDRSFTGLPLAFYFGVAPDGSRAYLSVENSQTMTVIDLNAFQVLPRIVFPANPETIAFPATRTFH